MKKNMVLLLIISTVVIIQIQYQIVPTYVADHLENNTDEYSQVKQSTQNITYTPLGSINITSNADFSKYNFTLGGDGTYYLTEFSILNSTVEPIYIENTNASFVISYCSLDSDDWNHDVISLTNVTNGRIEHCIIKNGIHGIKLSSDCKNIVIDSNIIINNSELGIGHYDSEYNFITNNDISNSGCNYTSPVGIGASTKGVSRVQQTGGQGVYMDPSQFVIVSGNSIHNNKHDGIHVVNSTYISIYDNCIYNNGPSECPVSPTIKGPISYKIQQTGGQGVYMDPSHNNTIHHNVFFENSEYGVWIEEGKNNTITFNDFIDNNGGNTQANDNNTDMTYNNSFSNNYWSGHNVTNPYNIDGEANNTDSSPRPSPQTKTCTSTPTTTPTTTTTPTPTPTTTTTTTTEGGSATGFSFTVIMLVLLTITLIVRKNPRFHRKE